MDVQAAAHERGQRGDVLVDDRVADRAQALERGAHVRVAMYQGPVTVVGPLDVDLDLEVGTTSG